MILYSVLHSIGFRPGLRRLLRMDVTGREHVPSAGPVILVANHESIYDPWVLGVVTQRPIRYVAKAELWRYPSSARSWTASGASRSSAAAATSSR